mgnify:CR=1 FL=1
MRHIILKKINVTTLESFEAGSIVDIQVLNEKGLIKLVKGGVGLKVLGNGTLTKALTVKAAHEINPDLMVGNMKFLQMQKKPQLYSLTVLYTDHR